MENKIIGIITDRKLLRHKSKRKHPQRPQRLSSILSHLENKLYISHPFIQYVEHIQRTASQEELKLVHKNKYIKHISTIWPKTSHRTDIMILDTYFNQYSQECSKIAVGGVLEAVDRVLSGKWKSGFALVRPPGHHSGGRNTVNGFCVFNNVAIAAKYLQQKHKKTRIAIVDWDVHHGDGTQHVFQDNKDILMISIHRYDRATFYPANQEGHVSNMGTGWALGTKVNISLDFIDQKFKEYTFQAPGDNQYIYIYHRIVQPLLKEFQPEFILVSSGFDAARGDPLGGFTVTPNGYYYMTKKLLQFQLPIVIALEGGYNLNSISQSAGAVIKGLLGEEGLPQEIKVEEKKMKNLCFLEEIMHLQIDNIIEVLAKHWPCLNTQQLKKYSEFIKQNKERVYGQVKDSDSSSSSSSSSSSPQKYQQQDSVQTQLPKIPQIKQTKKKSKSKNKKKQQQIKQQQEKDQSVTNQFYFAAGHLQRFKNFSPSNEKVSKLTHDEEINFYENLGIQKNFTPKYYGKQGNYIIIENLLYDQIDPVVIDIKLSRQSCNQTLSAERRQKEKKKQQNSTSQKYGFRISGYTTPTYKEGGILVKSEDLVKKILKAAIDNENKESFCTYLKQLSEALQKTNRKYFGTSIVLIKGPKKSEIRWVDFHYWYETTDGSVDQNTIQGIRNLINFIKQVEID